MGKRVSLRQCGASMARHRPANFIWRQIEAHFQHRFRVWKRGWRLHGVLRQRGHMAHVRLGLLSHFVSSFVFVSSSVTCSSVSWGNWLSVRVPYYVFGYGQEAPDSKGPALSLPLGREAWSVRVPHYVPPRHSGAPSRFPRLSLATAPATGGSCVRRTGEFHFSSECSEPGGHAERMAGEAQKVKVSLRRHHPPRPLLPRRPPDQ